MACSQKKDPGADFWEASLCLTHHTLLSFPTHVTVGKSDLLEKTHHTLFPCPMRGTDLEISVPGKPAHFNEPWPTALTESFSHVKCAATADPGQQKLPPPRDISQCLVTTTWALNSGHVFPAALKAQEKLASWSAGSHGSAAEARVCWRNTSWDKEWAGSGVPGQEKEAKPNQSSSLAKTF